MTPLRSKKISSGSNRSHTRETEHMSRLILTKASDRSRRSSQTISGKHAQEHPQQ